MAQHILKAYWHPNTNILQVQITALDPQPHKIQADLFDTSNSNRQELNKTMDRINQRYGDFKLAPGRLLNRSEMPDVIGPCQKE